jgi:hypothetical protein
MNFIIAVVSGLLLVFSTLVLLYRRFLSPLVNMSSLLLAPLGGLLGLLITGMEISMPVYIGLLMLLGIVAKNSILLVDFAIEEMDHGISKMEALLDAGRKRAQPIVMTTVAMVAGMVPTALSLSGDGAWRAPMGVVVIGGLILSTSADAADRSRGLQPRRQHRETPRPLLLEQPAHLQEGRRYQAARRARAAAGRMRTGATLCRACRRRLQPLRRFAI